MLHHLPHLGEEILLGIWVVLIVLPMLDQVVDGVSKASGGMTVLLYVDGTDVGIGTYWV
jgi:hypothetical protein